MGLYEKLGLDDAMISDEMLDVLERERQYWKDVQTSAADTRSHFYNDPVRQQNADESAFMLHGISVITDLLEQVGGVIRQPALPVRTVCCAVDSGLSDLGGFVDAVVFVSTKQIFKSDYHTILDFLDGSGRDNLAQDWRDFARYHERIPDQETGSGHGRSKEDVRSSESEHRREREPGHAGGQPSGRKKKRAGETILVSIIVVLAVVVIGGAYVIYRAGENERSAEEAAGAALSGITGSGQSASGGDSANGSTASASGDESNPAAGASGSSLAETGTTGSTDNPEDAADASDGADDSSSASSEETAADIQAALAGIADYTITSDESAFPSLTEVSCSDASATSVLVGESGTSYGADRMVDDDITTSWQEGEDDDGKGQSVTFDFDSTEEIRAIALWTGSHGSEGAYKRNNRPEDVTVSITCDGETSHQRMTLQDVDGEQMIVFDQPVPSDSISFAIDTVYRGTDYNDTAISEVKFYTE